MPVVGCRAGDDRVVVRTDGPGAVCEGPRCGASGEGADRPGPPPAMVGQTGQDHLANDQDHLSEDSRSGGRSRDRPVSCLAQASRFLDEPSRLGFCLSTNLVARLSFGEDLDTFGYVVKRVPGQAEKRPALRYESHAGLVHVVASATRAACLPLLLLRNHERAGREKTTDQQGSEPPRQQPQGLPGSPRAPPLQPP